MSNNRTYSKPLVIATEKKQYTEAGAVSIEDLDSSLREKIGDGDVSGKEALSQAKRLAAEVKNIYGKFDNVIKAIPDTVFGRARSKNGVLAERAPNLPHNPQEYVLKPRGGMRTKQMSKHTFKYLGWRELEVLPGVYEWFHCFDSPYSKESYDRNAYSGRQVRIQNQSEETYQDVTILLNVPATGLLACRFVEETPILDNPTETMYLDDFAYRVAVDITDSDAKNEFDYVYHNHNILLSKYEDHKSAGNVLEKFTALFWYKTVDAFGRNDDKDYIVFGLNESAEDFFPDRSSVNVVYTISMLPVISATVESVWTESHNPLHYTDSGLVGGYGKVITKGAAVIAPKFKGAVMLSPCSYSLEDSFAFAFLNTSKPECVKIKEVGDANLTTWLSPVSSMANIYYIENNSDDYARINYTHTLIGNPYPNDRAHRIPAQFSYIGYTYFPEQEEFPRLLDETEIGY